MPIFEYECAECRGRFEQLVRNADEVRCPACGSPTADKLLSAPAAHVRSGSLPISGACPPADAPPCGPGCCRLP